MGFKVGSFSKLASDVSLLIIRLNFCRATPMQQMRSFGSCWIRVGFRVYRV